MASPIVGMRTWNLRQEGWQRIQSVCYGIGEGKGGLGKLPTKEVLGNPHSTTLQRIPKQFAQEYKFAQFYSAMPCSNIIFVRSACND